MGDKLDTNGKIALSSIIISLATAAALGWGFWQTGSTIELLRFASQGGRFTQADSERLRREIMADIKRDLPPTWLVDSVEDIRKHDSEFEKRLDKLERYH